MKTDSMWWLLLPLKKKSVYTFFAALLGSVFLLPYRHIAMPLA